MIVDAMSSPQADTLPALSVLRPCPGLAERYRRLVLICHPDQLPERAEPGCLLISSEWLTWRRALDAGLPCLHIEYPLGRWPAEAGDPVTAYLRHGSWMEVGGRDLTEFHGHSLGRAFENDVVFFSIAYERIWHALDRLIARFAPEQVELIGLQAEWHLLSAADARRIAAELAERHGVALIDRLTPPARPLYACESFDGVMLVRNPLKEALRDLYARAVQAAFALGPGCKRPKVLMYLNRIGLEPLLAENVSPLSPALLADMWPKTRAFLSLCWRAKATMLRLPRARLDAADLAQLAAMARALEQAWAARPATGVERGRRHFIRALLHKGALAERALLIKRVHGLFEANRLTRVVVGDCNSSFAGMLTTEAGRRGIPCDEMPNGMFLSDTLTEARGAPGRKPQVQRILCWGEQQQAWIAKVAPEARAAVVGYPVLDPMLRRGLVRPAGRRRALLLPIYVDYHDITGLQGNVATWLVETIAILRRHGFEDFRVKVHPGFQVKEYYEAVLSQAGIDAPVFKSGSVGPQVEWADAVFGPPNSGSLVEAAALARPYYALGPNPTSMNPAYTAAYGAVHTLPELDAMLARGEEPDRATILARQCSVGRFPSATRRVWEVLAEQDTSPLL